MGKDLKGNPLPPGIMQRKSGIYRGRFYYKGETYTKDNADLKKLVQEMEDLRYEVKHGLKGKGDNITLDTWFDIWLNTHKKRTIKESTQVRYDDFYRRYIKKQIGKQRVADFNPIILERLLQNMADDDYSTKTIRDVYNILNAMFKYAVHNRILTFNPCVNDTYVSVWNTIPPTRPHNFMSFICKIARNLSLKRLEFMKRKKRSAEIILSLDELAAVLPDERYAPDVSDEDVGKLISKFLRSQEEYVRNVFIRKYFYFDSIREIAKRYSFTESKVKNMLFYTRNKLKDYLIKEDVEI